jgi:hypothetical protein
VNDIFELTRGNIIGEHVDDAEQLLDHSQKFNSGTHLTIIRPAHAWGTVKGLEYCTVQIGGDYFNIPALVLAKSIRPRRSADPAEANI